MSIFMKKESNSDTTKIANYLKAEDFENLAKKIKGIYIVLDENGKVEFTNDKSIEDIKSLFKYDEGIYEKVLNETNENGFFYDDVEVYFNEKKQYFNITSYKIQSLNKVFMFFSNVNKYYEEKNRFLEDIDRKDEFLKSKDLFIANLSHEIRTPINIIVGMIYFLKDTYLNDKQLEYINKLDEASNLLLEMVNGILDLSEKKTYSVMNANVDFNFKNLIESIIEIYEERIKENGLQLYVNLNLDSNINVCADKARITQVFVNLIENAIKYTEKGFIELEGKKVEENNISYKLQFCLKDTGVGIKKEDTINIFREFSQVENPTKKTQDGKGMGLAIAKKIVEDMNGKMWVESSVGLGSKFYFNIVLEKSNKTTGIIENFQKSENNILSSKDTANLANSDINILLVEDNDLNIEITKKIIEEINYNCEVAKDGIEAIKQIRMKGSDYYDLILMDIHMPRYNGYEISKILKNDMEVKIPIVALTATTITDEIINENKNYITDYIQKPIKPSEFKEKIKSYLNLNVDVKPSASMPHILLFGDDIDRLKELKSKLTNNFEVAITKTDIDAQILLETGGINAILVDEFKNLDDEFKFVNDVKCDKNYCKLPIVLINEEPSSKLKEKAFEYDISGIVENYEIEKCGLAVQNILNKLAREDELENIAEKSKEETANVYNFLFESMVNLTTSKSKETGEHLSRTKEDMKVMLAKYEEFYKEQLFTSHEIIEDISMAAILHDIGKVGIPDAVLNKPGKLDDEEYEIIKSHVSIGKNILETTYGNKISNNILNYAKDIVYHHHEKYDGSGYPEHLSGDQISVVSRIMAVIDVYDALVNDRVYKKAMPYEEVEKYIADQSGKAFDPKVVNVFGLVKDKLRAINEEHKDENAQNE